MVKVGNPSKMYPKNVFHCPCVAFQVKMCLIEGHYSLKDIISYLNENLTVNHKIPLKNYMSFNNLPSWKRNVFTILII